MRPLTRIGMPILLAVALTTPAWAEVGDKEASVPGIWTAAALFAALAILAGRWRLWAGLLLWLLGVVWAVGPILEWHDPQAGPAIAQEMGRNYGLHAYAAMIAAIALPALMLIGRRKRA